MLLIIYVSSKMIKFLKNQREHAKYRQHNDNDVADNDIDLYAEHSIDEISKLLLTNVICVQIPLCEDYFMNFDSQKNIIFNLVRRSKSSHCEYTGNSGFLIRISKFHLQIIWIREKELQVYKILLFFSAVKSVVILEIKLLPEIPALLFEKSLQDLFCLNDFRAHATSICKWLE